MTAAPAFVRNGRLDILATNRLGRALYSELFSSSAEPPNTARFVFLDPRSTEFYVHWAHVANEVVAILRSEAGRDPYDRGLSDLIGELSTQSEHFRGRWAAHNVGGVPELLVRCADLASCRLVEDESLRARPRRGAHLEVERFALSTNNASYAALLGRSCRLRRIV